MSCLLQRTMSEIRLQGVTGVEIGDVRYEHFHEW
jgi:hypothetical protein